MYFDVIDIWHLGSIFVRITYILELLFTIYVHEWMHNYGLPIIHGRILVVFFFTGCNREAGHKIRFPP